MQAPLFTPESDGLALGDVTGHGGYSTASQTFSGSDDIVVHTVRGVAMCTLGSI